MHKKRTSDKNLSMFVKNICRHASGRRGYNQKMQPPELHHALAVEGSYAAIARRLGLQPSRVRNWKYSLPEAWRIVLRAQYARRKPRHQPVNDDQPGSPA